MDTINFEELAVDHITRRLSESGLSGGLLDGLHCTDAFSQLVIVTGDLGRAIVLFDSVFYQGKTLNRPAAWIAEEVEFEIEVEKIGRDCRDLLIRQVLEQADEISDYMLDKYSERKGRFRYDQE